MNKINQMITYILICCMERDGLWAGKGIKTATIIVSMFIFNVPGIKRAFYL